MLEQQIRKLVPDGDSIKLKGKDYSFEIYCTNKVGAIGPQPYYLIDILDKTTKGDSCNLGTTYIPDILIILDKFGGYIPD